ncbi:hypothetical protein EJ05DRAFT_171847 [Pseudovirgaria hyperparasitica]|uniref:Pleckstrin homology domain-containing protein n=1 Tax=Pseudovirgaria hyperparasitica TaxID=470096 RepID=A0A6A6VVQ3_9PEZI|nr:uncharacterized protein EJ05DRAFT_171847 [Pseudovirgaria hyperparasitica]KAF2753794.1 hypothetical protein EJ05DRAFT_171847 [Pseudovirgaria hyperparasitica]
MDYFSEQDVHHTPHAALPTPSDTPYHTPVPSSRRSSRFGTPSPLPLSSSPPPLPPDPASQATDPANDEKISILDPRRFTPTLHANLVSEILTLRRELDSKHRYIEGIETDLEAAKSENDALNQEISQRDKKNRSLKSQLKHFEDETMSALDQLAKEKEDITAANQELKTRLEASQKRVKIQDDESDRIHTEWEREKEQWEGEKRVYERRVHATETRLRIVLDELAAQQPAEAHGDSEAEDATMDSGLGNDSDTASNYSRSGSRTDSITRLSKHGRTMSNSSHKSIGRLYRFSTQSINGVESVQKVNGMSLADELKFDEEDEDLEEFELDSDDFPEHEMRARRALESRQSTYQDEKAKRILGLMNDSKADADVERSKSVESVTTRAESRTESRTEVRADSRMDRVQSSFDSTNARDSCDGWLRYRGTPSTVYEVESIDTTVPKPQYVDTGVQYSPPPSPVLAPVDSKDAEPVVVDESCNANEAHEVEANQRRKRVSLGPPNSTVQQSSEPMQDAAAMVSSSMQTTDHPLSPPATPKLEQSPPRKLGLLKTNVSTTATQTDPVNFADQSKDEVSHSKRSGPPSPITVPCIVISPTLSAPSSPRQAVLPPNTRNIAVQASFVHSVPMRSVSVQTESIRSATRFAKLPPHLLPSAIRSTPGTPEPGQEPDNKSRSELSQVSEKLLGRVALLRMAHEGASDPQKSDDTKTENRYPGNNDNGFIVQNKGEGIRRPFRTSSLFAGFTGASSDEDEDRGDASDEESKSSLRSTTTPGNRALKHGRPFGTPPTPVPEENENLSRSNSKDLSGTSPRASVEKQAKIVKPLQRSSSSKRLSGSIRRSALIHSGNAVHMQRSRSPSLGSTNSGDTRRYVTKPPFPVPTRSSSRRLPMSKSEGSQSPTHRPNGAMPGRLGGYKKHARQDSLRKVRSAAVIQRGARVRSRSPPLSAQPSESSQIPPMPNDVVASPQLSFSNSKFGHKADHSTNTILTGSGSVGSSVQSNSVVDAIAATMVGEWMWKYVRKRKSFGVTESPNDIADDGNGVRHRRWVWLSPYERSVMWSSKQPTSGTALLGKSGRKLTIQSVLDVPDNAPPPKMTSGQQVFNRSILILTPARALKFTAVSKERHYLWLTALSFLASSGNGHHEVETSTVADSTPPPIPTRAPPEIPKQQGSVAVRRPHIRDSVRLAKEKSQPSMHSGAYVEPIQEYYSSRASPSISDAALPPCVPRYGHGRKRSATGPRIPPPPINTSFRSFSSNQVPQIHSAGLQSTASSEYYAAASAPSSIYSPQSVVTSGRPSESSTIAHHNFFDAMGTVRMEAFVAETTRPNGEETTLISSMWGNGRKPIGRKRNNSQWSSSTNEGHRMLEELGYDPHDPFRGF